MPSPKSSRLSAPGHRNSGEYEPRYRRTGSGRDESLTFSARESYSLQRQSSSNGEPARRSSLTDGIATIVSRGLQAPPKSAGIPFSWYEGWTIRKSSDAYDERGASWASVTIAPILVSQEELQNMVIHQARNGSGSDRQDYEALEYEEQCRHLDELVDERNTSKISAIKVSIAGEFVKMAANSQKKEYMALHVVLRCQIKPIQVVSGDPMGSKTATQERSQPVTRLPTASPPVSRRVSSAGHGSLPNRSTEVRRPITSSAVNGFPVPSATRGAPPSAAGKARTYTNNNTPEAVNVVAGNGFGQSGPHLRGFTPSGDLPGLPRTTPPAPVPNEGVMERDRRPYGQEGSGAYERRKSEEEQQRRSSEHARRSSEQSHGSRPMMRQSSGARSGNEECAVYGDELNEGGPSRRRSSGATRVMYAETTEVPQGSTLAHTSRSSMESAHDGDPEGGSRRRRFSDDHPQLREEDGPASSWRDGGYATASERIRRPSADGHAPPPPAEAPAAQLPRRRRTVSFAETREQGGWPAPLAPTPVVVVAPVATRPAGQVGCWDVWEANMRAEADARAQAASQEHEKESHGRGRRDE